MPTYKNTGTSLITIQDVSLEAGQTVVTEKYLPEPLPSDISKLNDDGHFNSFILSQDDTGDTDDKINITLPQEDAQQFAVQSFRLVISCIYGEVDVYFDDATCVGVKQVNLVEGQNWNVKFLSRVFDKITYKCKVDGCEVKTDINRE